MRVKPFVTVGIFLAVATLAGCDSATDPAAEAQFNIRASDVPAPAPLVTVAGETFWPYTGVDFSGVPQDPLNLVFAGEAASLNLRALLLSLDGDRTAYGFPDEYPFNCTWQDAIGGVQAAYGTSAGWVGSAIQLECGTYEPVRFHVRFFDLGDVTLGNAHMEILIEGTSDHQVISWEHGEQLLLADFVRSGLLGALPSSSGPINDVPFKAIPAIIYNGMPAGLRLLVSGSPDLTETDVPIPTDGQATVLTVAGTVTPESEIARQEFVIEFGQVIPKPFCAAGPYDYLYVSGPVNLRQQVVVTPSGNYLSQFHAVGRLELVPFDPINQVPIGEPYTAQVNEHHKGIVTDNVTLATQFMLQIEIPPKGPFHGSLRSTLNVGPGGASHSSFTVRCEP